MKKKKRTKPVRSKKKPLSPPKKKRGSQLQKHPSATAFKKPKKRKSKTPQETIEKLIADRLDKGEDYGRVRVVPYSDGSVDGELLAQIPRGVTAKDLLIDIENALGVTGIGEMWFTVGVRFTIKEDDEVYRRFRGYNDVNTHYQRMQKANVVDVFDIARHQIVEGMEDKYGRKPDSIYVRIHWNPYNTKPRGRES